MGAMGNRVRQIREMLHMSQKQFGERLGIKQNTVTQWESERIGLAESTIKHICVEYGINEDWLREGTGPIFQSQFRGKNRFDEYFPNISPKTAALIRTIMELPPELQNLLADVITASAANIQASGDRKTKAVYEDAELLASLAQQLQTEDGQTENAVV